MTRRKPIPVKTSIIKAPEITLKLHLSITLEIDIFFVKSLPFLWQCHNTWNLERSRTWLTEQKKIFLDASAMLWFATKKRIKNWNYFSGPRIWSLHRWNQKEDLKTLSPASNVEHAPEAERHIRTLKWSFGATHIILEYKKRPRQIVIKLVKMFIHGWIPFHQQVQWVTHCHPEKFSQE